METVQWIISAGTGLVEATKLKEDLSRLRTSLPRARLLIDRAEWERFITLFASTPFCFL